MSNEFQVFASAAPGTANSLSPASLAALTTLLANGFQTGTALSEQVNTVLRQATTAASGMGKFADDYGPNNALDNGSATDFALAVKAAVDAIVAAAIVSYSSSVTIPTVVQGTFTPTIRFGGNGAGMTFSAQDGRYVKINNMVQFWAYVVLSAKGSSTGAATLAGLPFASNGTYAAMASADVLSGLTGSPSGIILNGSTTIQIRQFDGSTGSPGSLTHTNFNNTSLIHLTGSYLV